MPPLPHPQRLPRHPGAVPAAGNGNGVIAGPRAHLAAAIAAKAQAVGDLTRAELAHDKAVHAWDAESALELTEQKLGEAQAEAGSAAVEALLAGRKPNGHTLMYIARQDYAVAEDNLAIAKAAEKQLLQSLPEYRKAAERAASAVTVAARNVIRSESPDLTAALKAAVDRVNALRAEVYWLYRQSCCADSPERQSYDQCGPLLIDRNEDSGTANLLRQCAAGMGHDEKHESWQRWEQSFNALMQNANAPLPVNVHAAPPRA
jgi:hypothetical protein